MSFVAIFLVSFFFCSSVAMETKVQFAFDDGQATEAVTVYKPLLKQFSEIENRIQNVPPQADAPLLLDLEKADFNKNIVNKSFELLLACIQNINKQEKIDDTKIVSENDVFFISKHSDTVKRINNSENALHTTQQMVLLANKFKLLKPYFNLIFDIYVDMLMKHNFTKSNELQEMLPNIIDLDKFIVQRIVQSKLLPLYQNSQQTVIEYMMQLIPMVPTATLEDLTFINHSPIPLLFMRASVVSTIVPPISRTESQSRLEVRIQALEERMLKNAWFDAYKALPVETLALAFYDNHHSAVMLSKENIQLCTVGQNNKRITRVIKELPQKVANQSVGIVKIHNDNVCIGYDDQLILFKVKEHNIVEFSSYDHITGSAQERITDLSVLNDRILITRKPPQGKYQYSIFDINKKENVKVDRYLEITFFDISPATGGNKIVGVHKKMAILLKDEDDCINRSMCMKAQGFTAIHNCYDIFIDDPQENIYMLEKTTEPFKLDPNNPSLKAKKFSIIPPQLKPLINYLNNNEKKLRSDENAKANLALETLYFIANKYPHMIQSHSYIKNLKTQISDEMKQIAAPTKFEQAQGFYYSLANAIKKQFKWIVGTTATFAAVGLGNWLFSKWRYKSTLPAPAVHHPSAVHRHLPTQ